jgi:hypothetical protein
MNNFQKLQEEQEDVYYSTQKGEDLKKDLLGTLTTFRFIGSVIDVYLPRVVDMFIAIAGGGAPDKSNTEGDSLSKRPNDPASGGFMPGKGKGPGESEDISNIR